MRLIDADDIAYESIDSSDTNRHEYYYGTGIVAIRKEDIDDAPTIDAVPVIRCKDCKYSVDYYNDGECYCRRPGREMQWISKKWDFFCKAGRRSDETD